MKIEFFGATKTVTGSMHLLSVNGKRFLLDCGLYQGRRKESYERNKNFPFDASTIDAVVLSHAHTDHAGNLPNLIKNGFSGPIYATSATIDLCNIMLVDSAHIQERDVEFVNKRLKKRGEPIIEPLYSIEDVEQTLPLFEEINYNIKKEILPGVVLEFFDAGHILGSASIRLEVEEFSKTGISRKIKFGFTGDLGRPKLPILRDPHFIGQVDALISESTYGGRFHEPVEDMPKKFLEVVERTISRGGKIIIPAFSLGRTQEIVYAMNSLATEERFPKVPVFVDSPLSVNTTEVFRRHPECFDKETLEILKHDDDIFGFDQLHYVRDVNDSKKLNTRKEPCIIISASGMCEAGRILHHLYNNISDPRNTVLIIGYQAQFTLGRKLVEQEKTVSIFGDAVERKCEVVVLNSFSGHADRNELLDYFSHFDKNELRKIFLVHGDLDQSEKFSKGLSESGFKNISIPNRLDTVEI